MHASVLSGARISCQLMNPCLLPTAANQVTVTLLKDAMEASDKSLFLIDGFPRNEENRAAFEKQVHVLRCLAEADGGAGLDLELARIFPESTWSCTSPLLDFCAHFCPFSD